MEMERGHFRHGVLGRIAETKLIMAHRPEKSMTVG
jgi:hypothetical protein